MVINLPVVLLKFLPYALRKTLNIQFRVRLNRREVIIPGNIDDGFQNVFWAMSWKAEIIERLVDARSGLFVDVGANVGQTLLDLHLINPQIPYVGFEPNIVCVHYLKELIQRNLIQNCQIIPVGLGDENACRPFYRHPGALTDSGASIISDLRPNRTFDVDIVPCYRFDDIQKSLNLGKIGFVKIDVEGAELETLIGMKTSVEEYRPLILCEVLFTDNMASLTTSKQRNDKLMQNLTEMDYSVWQLIKSEDLAHVIDVRKSREFTSAYWSDEKKDLCDYLFIPNEKATNICGLLSQKGN